MLAGTTLPQIPLDEAHYTINFGRMKTMSGFAAGILLMLTIGLASCEKAPERVVDQSWTETQPKLVKYFQAEGDNRVKIKEEKFYEDGTREYVGTFDETGKRHGEWRYFFPNGNLWSLGEYKNGLKHGKKEVYWPDGTKRYVGQFKDDEKSGKWTFFDTDGSILQEMDFSEANTK